MQTIEFAGTEVRVVRSKRKSIGLEVKLDGTVTLRLPYRVSLQQGMDFLSSREEWLKKHLQNVEEQNAFDEAGEVLPLTEEELSDLTRAARDYFTAQCERYAPIVGVRYGRVTIRHQKTRWGSCSAKGNLNFNCLLMLAPEEVREYVVVHELCHRKHMDHSPAFWAEVEKVLPDYRAEERWLKKEGAALQRRLPKKT